MIEVKEGEITLKGDAPTVLTESMILYANLLEDAGIDLSEVYRTYKTDDKTVVTGALVTLDRYLNKEVNMLDIPAGTSEYYYDKLDENGIPVIRVSTNNSYDRLKPSSPQQVANMKGSKKLHNPTLLELVSLFKS